jgi:monoamine oxidase
MHTLLDADFWQGVMFDEAFDMQATMFQPVGGMDRIPYAFAKSLGDIVQYNAPVLEIRKTSRGVRIGYMQGGTVKQIEADYCICALPLPILRKIPNDLSAPFKKIFAECTYDGAYKIAWESRRFWEQDYNIYGGLEFVNTGCSPIWLPSAGMFTERGIIVSGYGFDESATLGDLTLEQKFTESRKSIERLHPGHGKEVEKPMYVGWSHVQWNEGSWLRSLAAEEKGSSTTLPRRTGPARNSPAGRMQHDPAYEQLIQPDGVIFFAGDHCSHIVGWQEGAALSAHYAINRLTDQVKAARLAGATATVKSS